MMAREQDFQDAFVENLGDHIGDMAREKFKVDWLAKWATHEVGAESPAEFLNIIGSLANAAMRQYPRLKFIDGAYRLAREQAAHSHMSEALRG